MTSHDQSGPEGVNEVGSVTGSHCCQQVTAALLLEGVPANVGDWQTLGGVKLGHLARDKSNAFVAPRLV